MKRKLPGKLQALDIFLYTSISLFSLFIIYPFYYVIINSFNKELSRGPAFFMPSVFTMRNYNLILVDSSILNAFLMSVLRTAVGTLAALFVCSACAYALRKKNISFRKYYIALFMLPMFFSGGLIPIYLNLKALNLLDNFLVYIIPKLVSFFFLVILMSCFNEIPDALEESANIDGAGHFKIYCNIYIPLSLPVMVTIGLFIGVGQWNSWMDTLYFTESKALTTLQAVLIRIIVQTQLNAQLAEGSMFKDNEKNMLSPEGIKMATMIVTVLPIIFVYPFLQRYFVKGIMIGAVKG